MKKTDQRQTAAPMAVNRVRELRQDRMMSKAELARRAEVTVQTIDRIEKGKDCRLDTKRKIILALGFELGERSRIFNSEEEEERGTDWGFDMQ